MKEDMICENVHNVVNHQNLSGRLKESKGEQSGSSDLSHLKDITSACQTEIQLLTVINSELGNLINFDHGLILSYAFDQNDYTILSFNNAISGIAKSIGEGATLHKYIADETIENLMGTQANSNVFKVRSFDLPQAPRWLKQEYASGMQEFLAIGLPARKKAADFILLFSGKLNSFTESSMLIAKQAAYYFGAALHMISLRDLNQKKARDQSQLLKFVASLAKVRTKKDLETAILIVLDQLMGIKLSMIRLIEDDGITLTPYLYDKNAAYADDELFHRLLARKTTIEEPTSMKVLKSDLPIVFDITNDQNDSNSSAYISLWRKSGKKKTYGARLRVGNNNIGTLWLLADELNTQLMRGLCSQIAVAIFNIKANEKLLAYKRQLEIENDHLKDQINLVYNFSEIIGKSRRMAKVYKLMSRVACSGSTVLILGETGTGKELIARAIHNASSRKGNLIVKVNCAALPPNLIESELFGHEKGAFSGAYEQRIGKFELAHNGTLFLDEIGELPLELQVKLLRVIQEREFERVGGSQTIKVNVRIIAATNRNLEKEVQVNKFRRDLYYRLNVFPIELPPLRERTEDIGDLANFFLQKHCKLQGNSITTIAPEVLSKFSSYSWPGNVRELEHIIERSILMQNDSVLREVHLPNEKQMVNPRMLLINQTLEEMERVHIINILRQCQGKVSGTGGASEILEVLPTTLHSKMRKLNITKSAYSLNNK